MVKLVYIQIKSRASSRKIRLIGEVTNQECGPTDPPTNRGIIKTEFEIGLKVSDAYA